VGDAVNLERSMPANGRFDGHLVQGHVDTTGKLEAVEDQNGSWLLTFSYPEAYAGLVVEKGSCCINGISLTVFNLTTTTLQVAIIPYTWQHTNLRFLQPGAVVNLEFDIIGKYLLRKLTIENGQLTGLTEKSIR
jgi:riboflavin synthase